MLHWQSLVVAVGQYIFYVGISSFLQYRFYFRRPNDPRWKLQPKHVNETIEEAFRWWWPLSCAVTSFRKTGRHPNHVFWASINLIFSCCFAAGVCEAYLRGWSNLLLWP